MGSKFDAIIPLFGFLHLKFPTSHLLKQLVLDSCILFLSRLFKYIQGKNEYKKTIEMTAPVISQVSPSDGPFCETSFVVSFYVPKENRADPPPAKGLHVQRWDPTYVAVRQFGGFVSDYEVAVEAASLQDSLAGSKWAAAVDKSRGDQPTSTYTVAQYNSPFEFSGRVNEIWLSFDLENE
ncbi:Heme-binding protein 2 [Bienertia sinuspersici]